MRLQYFVHENETGKRVEIEIEPALQGDLEATKDGWQSDWTSAFIADPKLEKYAAKTDELYENYVHDFHAVPIFQPFSGGPKLLMLADEGAQNIFSTYLF